MILGGSFELIRVRFFLSEKLKAFFALIELIRPLRGLIKKNKKVLTFDNYLTWYKKKG